MRRLIPLALLALLALPGTAPAKEPRYAKVCGASGCRELTDRALLMRMVEGGPPAAPPRKAGPWYGAEFTIVEPQAVDHFEVAVYLDAGRVKGEDGTWMTMAAPQRRAYERATRGLRPYGAERQRAIVKDQGTGAWPWLAGGGVALLMALAVVLRRRLA